MYTPEELESFSIALESIMTDLESSVMSDIVRRIKINEEITRSADWQMYRLTQMGESSDYIKKQIAKALNLSGAEIDKLYSEAMKSGYVRDKALYTAMGIKFTAFEDNLQLQQLISAIADQTKTQITNITQTMGFAINMNGKLVFTPFSQYFQRIMDESALGVLNGTYDYNATLKKIVQEMTKSGIRTVDYATGWSNNVITATRRALMTGTSQVTNKINEMNAEKLNTDYFEVTYHSGARPDHQKWQGKVYSKAELESKCGLGTIGGLGGANCRHSYFPFVKGVSKRSYTDKELAEMDKQENSKKSYAGKEYTTYEATQRQRQMEALMRKQRQDIVLLKKGNVNEDDLITVKAKYRATSQQYADFSAKMGLQEQRQRVYVDGLGRV